MTCRWPQAKIAARELQRQSTIQADQDLGLPAQVQTTVYAEQIRVPSQYDSVSLLYPSHCVSPMSQQFTDEL